MAVADNLRLREVEVQPLDAARLEPLIGADRMALYEDVAEATQAALAGRAVWNVNSTATGGGVAEMLQTLLAYVRAAGIDARWLVIEGDPEFFAITKRIHNGIYGSPGDGGELGAGERRHYERGLRRNAEELLAPVRAGGGEAPAVPFTRRDGSLGRINRHVDLLQSGPAAPPDAPLVVQVSRWDRMKDMPGVMQGFAEHVDPSLGAHLVLAGPSVTGVADDPEGAEVLEDCIELWRSLPHAARGRVHLACTPMTDPDEAAAIVNALQRHATVVVQKSLAEGFGLTVAEAMWKARPVIGGAVGGIVDQIEHGESGLLVADPTDLPAFGAAVETLLRDRELAETIGRNAQQRAAAQFLGDRHLEQYGCLFARLG